VLVIVIEKSLD